MILSGVKLVQTRGGFATNKQRGDRNVLSPSQGTELLSGVFGVHGGVG